MAGRIMGLDYGLARIGVALSDPTRTLATPHSVVHKKNQGEQIRDVVALIEEVEATALVVGMPFEEDGNVGDMAQRAEKFALKLESVTGLTVHRVDERYSSIEADALLRSLPKSKRRRKNRGPGGGHPKGELDRIAAALVLQSFLDGL